MKAQRRHQLQQNSLAAAIENLPESVRNYGPRILIAIVIIGLIFALIRYRTMAAQDRRQLSLDRLATARGMIEQLRSASLIMMSPEQISSTRKDVWTEAGAALADIQSDDPGIQAETLAAKGNLAWLMANTPDLPGATTRPSLKLEVDREDLLGQAQKYYDEILNRYLEQRPAAIAAHFGLAAIAENHGDWQTASDHYVTLMNDPTTPISFRNQAMLRRQMLGDIKDPLMLAGEILEPTTKPSTQPTTQTIEALGPSTQPATQPAH